MGVRRGFEKSPPSPLCLQHSQDPSTLSPLRPFATFGTESLCLGGREGVFPGGGSTRGSSARIINTPSGKLSVYDNSYIRKAAIKFKVPYITTLAAAIAAAKGIAAYRKGKGSVRSLQEYHADIR